MCVFACYFHLLGLCAFLVVFFVLFFFVISIFFSFLLGSTNNVYTSPNTIMCVFIITCVGSLLRRLS